MGFRWRSPDDGHIGDLHEAMAERGHPYGGIRPRCDWRGCTILWPRSEPRAPRLVAILHSARNRALGSVN